MTDTNSILMYESALSAEARRKLRQIRWADVVIGIPTHRNARTLDEVLDAVTKGIDDYMPNKRVLLMNADGGSSDNTVRCFLDLERKTNTQVLTTEYLGTTGKGTAIRSVFEATHLLGAQACMVIEARAPGILPEWLPALIDPVLRGHEMAVGCYQQSAFGSSLTDLIAYPVLRSYLRTDLRDPLAPEFCVSGELAGHLAGRDIWETDVSRFGINAWMTTECVCEGRRVCQVDLGYRGDPSFDPGTVADARFLHAVAVLLRALAVRRERWRVPVAPILVPFAGGRSVERVIPEPDTLESLLSTSAFLAQRYYDLWPSILSKETMAAVDEAFNGADNQPPASISNALWSRILVDFAIVYNQGEGDPDKVIEALIPLFYGRTVTYMQEADGRTVTERQRIVDELVALLAASHKRFVSRWDSFDDDLDADAAYWLT